MTHNARTIIFVVSAFRLLDPEVAKGAEKIITPLQLQSDFHFIDNYSVWGGDSTIALDVNTGSLESKVWTVQRFRNRNHSIREVGQHGKGKK